MPNYVLDRRDALSVENYVLVASPENDYWVAFAKNMVDDYSTRFGSAFNIVIAGSEQVEGDFYAIPYSQIRHMLNPGTMYPAPRRRWVASITAHELRVRNYPVNLDVSIYYGGTRFLDQVEHLTVEELNDHAVESRRMEVEVRTKQSQFRDRVLSNFEYRCCISGIAESDLLVAGHIVPWSERIETRLDPSNGICLFVSYDKLFDLGYFTIDEDLRVSVSNRIPRLSEWLRRLLQEIDGREINHPIQHDLNPEYTRYHRENIFQVD